MLLVDKVGKDVKKIKCNAKLFTFSKMFASAFIISAVNC